MKDDAAPGWVEVLTAPCFHAELVHAALEAHGFRAVLRRVGDVVLSPGWFNEQCRVYVPEDQAGGALSLIHDAELDPGLKRE